MPNYMLTRVFFVLMFIIFFVRLPAQRIIAGKVVDAASQQPLEAASVGDAEDPARKTLTDRYGNFSLRVLHNDADLTASFIGYKATTIRTQKAGALKIELQPD